MVRRSILDIWNPFQYLGRTMKITDIKITPVTVPMEAPLRWSMGVETGTTRGIIQLFTDEGIVGIGETYGGNAIEHALHLAKPFVVGLDPLEVGVLMHRLNVFCIRYERDRKSTR